MKNVKKLCLLIVVISTLVTFTGCKAFEEKVEMQSFTHKEAGFSFQVPLDWKLVEEDDVKVIFKAEEKPITFYTREELGGISIYTPDEIAKKLVEEFEGVLTDVEVLRDSYSYSMDKAYRIIFKGKIKDSTYVVKAFVREQDLGIRHYLVFISPEKEFYRSDFLYEDIARSFRLAKNDMEYYEKLSPHYKKDEKLKEMEKLEEKSKEKDNETVPKEKGKDENNKN